MKKETKMASSEYPASYSGITWGDTVDTLPDAPAKYKPAARGSACGFRIVESQREAEVAGEPIGTRLWIVEFADGSSLEVPEHYLVRPHLSPPERK